MERVIGQPTDRRPSRLVALPPPLRRCDPLSLAVWVWLALALAVSVRTLLRPATHTVYPVFAAGAERWWADRPLYARDPALDDFRYPPPFAVLMTPLASLGLAAG